MSVRIAEHAGFCFGVKRATGLLEREIENCRGTGRRICTLGRIIHNDHYIAGIKAAGVEELTRDDVPAVIEAADRGGEITVVIRAHGERREILEQLTECEKRNPGFRLLDGTCPYVTKVRRIAEENSGEGKIFLLSGNAAHPEVEGILSCARGETHVFPGAEELDEWLQASKHADSEGKNAEFCGKSISIAAQTTQNLAEWRKSINFIKIY